VKREFRVADLLRCNLTKVLSEIRVFQYLLTHLNRTRDLTGRKEKTSAMRSSERDGNPNIPLSLLRLGMKFGRVDDGKENCRTIAR